MITNLSLQNYRGFKEHDLPFASMSVVVGKNNAGKTTIVEALRLLSMVTLRYRKLPFKSPPSDTDIPRRLIGVTPSLKNVDINFNTIFNHYNEPPGLLVASFINGTSVTVYILSEGRIHAVIQDTHGQIVKNNQQAARVELPEVRIMPQVAPLQREKTILNDDYVKATMSSRLAPMHFRNQLRIRYDLYNRFKEVVENTWPGVQIQEFIGRNGLPDEKLYLEIRNEDFVAEVADMGHGLQMWLQTMWFLTFADNASTIILDEPDVYMHADLQRRIIRYLRNRHDQTIITTHSVEIMSEVLPDEILIVDKKRRESCFAVSVPAVQSVINRFGSVHNLHLTRLLNANRMILVEGDDLKILKEFQDIMFPQSDIPFQSLPNMPIGGWGGWTYAIGTSMGFHNTLGQNIITYCIFDSDYHSDVEINKRYQEAQGKDIQLHIWHQKEIENYLLVPSAISRFIASKITQKKVPPNKDEITNQLILYSNELENEIFDALSTEYLNNNRKTGQTGANCTARERIKSVREKFGNIISLASGKELLGSLSNWSKTEYGVSFSSTNIAHVMELEEINSEIINVVKAIEHGKPFSI
ncbi:MAG: AAA family ATPase [Candidatus Latescibacteria bacterium]|nr:AAA family ATPase [Candidatus Latescibacterota bacterium]